LKNNLSCILLENTNAVLKIGRRMCVTCLFEVHDLSLLSTRYVALRTNYNTEITQHKHTIHSNHNQTREAIKKYWFNILDLLRYYDKRDMVKDLTCKIWI
jgi:hypothetical protein